MNRDDLHDLGQVTLASYALDAVARVYPQHPDLAALRESLRLQWNDIMISLAPPTTT
jgi:hypothetical protein